MSATIIGGTTAALPRAARIGLWSLRGTLAVLFIAAGLMKLMATSFEVESFAHFGYAPWFMYAIGILELAGGLALLSRAMVLPGALGLAVVMLGALASHWRAGDAPGHALPALVVLGLLVLLMLAQRRQPG
jgi:uncharacterized membrane protein YphA (DoxX/SURF4 family)